MKKLNRQDFPGVSYPEKILQFGEGNFLRAFVDWQIDVLNEQTDLNAGITIVRPIDTDFPPSLDTQDGLYTTLIRGINEQGEPVRHKRLIRSVNRELNCYQQFDLVLASIRNPDLRFFFSNTTEAGIAYKEGEQLSDVPYTSFPAKLTALLFERYGEFAGADDKGLIILPCELIDYNGEQLKEIVFRYAKDWSLPIEFIDWLENHNTFCSTLVDRIVTGFPRGEHEALENELEYHDQFIDTAEYFYLFVIQGPDWLKQALCLDQLSEKNTMNIKIVSDIKPYKERKVAILNGAHTALVPVAFLAGIETVGEAMSDNQIRAFIERTIHQEIIPTLDLPQAELVSFAQDVLDRFRNPFIKHQLLSIALNSMTKFRTRILPQLLAYQKTNQTLPKCLVFSLAALIVFYRGRREQGVYDLNDDPLWLNRFQANWQGYDEELIPLSELVSAVLGDTEHWGVDLMQVPDLAEAVADNVFAILKNGIRSSLPDEN